MRTIAILILLLLSACTFPDSQGNVLVVTSENAPAELQQEPESIVPRVRTVEAPKEPVLEVDFLKAGHGDATLIRTPDGKRILINCGTAAATEDLRKYFRSQNISSIDILLTTNSEASSVGACSALKAELRIGRLLDHALQDLTSERSNAVELLKRGFVVEGGKFFLRMESPVKIQLLIPYDSDRAKRADDHTLVPVIQYGDRRILLLNNCGFGCQRELAAEDLRADVLQLAQQGREEANSDKLFDQIRPSIAIASVGVNNAERLPRKDLMQNLNQRRIKLYRTDVQYTISLVTNGKTLDVESEVPYRLERI